MRNDTRTAERLIVHVLLQDHTDARSITELQRELTGIDPETIRQALGILQAEGVAHVSGEEVRASQCAQHLSGDLELIAI